MSESVIVGLYLLVGLVGVSVSVKVGLMEVSDNDDAHYAIAYVFVWPIALAFVVLRSWFRWLDKD